jgi:hypothetical protein
LGTSVVFCWWVVLPFLHNLKILLYSKCASCIFCVLSFMSKSGRPKLGMVHMGCWGRRIMSLRLPCFVAMSRPNLTTWWNPVSKNKQWPTYGEWTTHTMSYTAVFTVF